MLRSLPTSCAERTYYSDLGGFAVRVAQLTRAGGQGSRTLAGPDGRGVRAHPGGGEAGPIMRWKDMSSLPACIDDHRTNDETTGTKCDENEEDEEDERDHAPILVGSRASSPHAEVRPGHLFITIDDPAGNDAGRCRNDEQHACFIREAPTPPHLASVARSPWSLHLLAW